MSVYRWAIIRPSPLVTVSHRTSPSGKVRLIPLLYLTLVYFLLSHSSVCVCICVSDVRWKNKFWGKSMEILPIGTVNVMLPRYSPVCFSAPFIHPAPVPSSAWLSVSYFLHLSAVMVITMSGTRWRHASTTFWAGGDGSNITAKSRSETPATLPASANSPLLRYMLICNNIYITNG